MSDVYRGNINARYLNDYGIVPNESIWEEILLRLSTKDLVRFKAVSKLWYAKISSPSFVKLHLGQIKENTKYIICAYPLNDYYHIENMFVMEDDGEFIDITLTGFHNVPSSIAICSFNGLLCISSVTGVADSEIRICNPTTGEVTLLPKCTLPAIFTSIGVVFNERETNYKIFRFIWDDCESKDDVCECEVYDSNDGIWKGIGQVPHGPVVNQLAPKCPASLCVQGKLYWLTWKENDREAPAFVQSVDGDGNFSKITLPGKDLTGYTFLINLDGALAVVTVDNAEEYVYIFVLEEDENEPGYAWSLKAKALLTPQFISTFNSVVGGKDEILFVINELNGFRYRLFNVAAKVWWELDLDDDLCGYSPVVFPFTETLLPCKGITDKEEDKTSSA